MMMEGGSSGSEEERNLKGLLSDAVDSSGENRFIACVKIHNRIMKLSLEELTEEAKWKEGEECSVLFLVAGPLHFPLDAIDRLVDALGIDYKDMYGMTVILHTSLLAFYDVVEYLARNKKADLSITTSEGDNIVQCGRA
jgi:hypothetical protein